MDPLAPEFTRALLWFNVLAIVIDVIPFWMMSISSREQLSQYFSVRSFFLGAVVNFMLVSHINFVLQPNEHMAALFVAMAGLFLGTACAFICLFESPLVQKSIRYLMCVLIIALVVGSYIVLNGIDQHFRADEGYSWIIRGLAILGVVLLNVMPHVESMVVQSKPDIKVDRFGAVVSFLTVIDACFFAVYATLLDEFGSLISISSIITASFNLVQFFLYLWRMH